MSFVVTYLGNELGVVWGKKVRKARPCWVAKGIDHYLTIIIQSSLMFVRLYCRSHSIPPQPVSPMLLTWEDGVIMLL